MNKPLEYTVGIQWTGTASTNPKVKHQKIYEAIFNNKPSIIGSADSIFHGDKNLYNPEELFLTALASCHMMAFFYLCNQHAIVLKSYTDTPVGLLKINNNGSGQFTQVTLQPKIKLQNQEILLAKELFAKAETYCFIARSCNFTIEHAPVFI